MSNLQDLVPPLELCKQIPEGKFEDSALIWVENCIGKMVVSPRDFPGKLNGENVIFHYRGIPAPTLQEIMDELVLKSNEPDCFWTGGWYVKADLLYGEFEEFDMTSPVTAALKL